jgi:spore coat protein SA
MKKILLSTSNVQPIPAIRGGATETLIDILIKENEAQKKYLFFILCKYDREAEIRSNFFKYTNVIYFKSKKDFSIFNLLFDKEIYIYFIVKFLASLGITNASIPSRYYYFAYRLCRTIKPDYFVAEGGIYEQYELVTTVIPSNRRYAHLHRVVNGNKKLWSIFPNAIAISNYVKSAYLDGKKLDKVNVNVVRNCCNELIFQNKPNKKLTLTTKQNLGFNDDDFIILYSGRIVQEKGVEELLNSIAKIPNKNIKLLIIGSPIFDGAKETAYSIKIQNLAKNLVDRVVMTGYIPNDQLYLYFSIASLCIVPSVWEEPVSLVPLEAMTYGLPVIISDSGGMIEYQKNECVLIVKRNPDLAKNISTAILFLYNNPNIRNNMILSGKVRSSEFSGKKFYKDFLKSLNLESDF